MSSLVPIVAHYGGIDEIGIFVVPALAIILVLRWAERRARERADSEPFVSEAEESSAPADGTGGDDNDRHD